MFGMRAHDLGRLPMEELASQLQDLDVSCIQLAIPKAIADVHVQLGYFSPGLSYAIAQAFGKRNVHISVLGSYINPTNPIEPMRQKEMATFKENLRIGRFLGADMVGTETGTYDPNYKHSTNFTYSEGAYQLFLRTMKELVCEAKGWGMMIGVEAVASHTIYSEDMMNRFLQDIDSPNVCVIFDLCNMLDERNYDKQEVVIERVMQMYGDRIAAVHLKDFAFVDGKKTIVPIGEGLLAFDRLFFHLKKQKPHIHMLLEGYGAREFISGRVHLQALWERCTV